jgi:malate dehydrogenase (oxaloacetate-decarboxylating)(NADP+)
VLGLGNIGPLASKPVMEGKAVLFKKFAGIDVFDIEIDAPSVDQIVSTMVAALEPTFGGINLEDIKAPECFQVEERRLRERMNIPVFHDDQHGTAIIVGAAVTERAGTDAGKKIRGREDRAPPAPVQPPSPASISCVITRRQASRTSGSPTWTGCWSTRDDATKLMDPWKEVYAQDTELRAALDEKSSTMPTSSSACRRPVSLKPETPGQNGTRAR